MIETLIAALIVVESSGNDFVVGDSGKAVGCLQIHACVIADVNRVYGTTYQWPESCYSRETSKEICRMYLKHYCTAKRIGRTPTMEDMSRAWNGGPNGWKKKATEKYWKKVSVEIRRRI